MQAKVDQKITLETSPKVPFRESLLGYFNDVIHMNLMTGR